MVPYLLGYHPEDGSLVAVLLAEDGRVVTLARTELSAPPAEVSAHLTRVTSGHGVVSVALVGYGPPSVAGQVRAAADAFTGRLRLCAVLLLTGGELFCLGCSCPDTAGRPFDPAATRTAAQATLAGMVALPSRAQLMALTDPDPGEQARTAAAIRALPAERGDDDGAVVRYLMGLAGDGQRLSSGRVARLVVLLRDLEVRDVAWRETGREMWQRDLWLDVTRRTPDGFLAAPAALAAWCAWLRGEEHLANAALARAQAADPGYGLAALIDRALRAHLPAELIAARWPLPGTDTRDASSPGTAGLGEPR
ncbi:hypothetical protein KRM28CT15_25080 [Krasilnikovia sp. M28-CT-15]